MARHLKWCAVCLAPVVIYFSLNGWARNILPSPPREKWFALLFLCLLPFFACASELLIAALEYKTIESLWTVARKHSADVVLRVNKAHTNVYPWLIKEVERDVPKHPSKLENLINRYYQLDKLSTEGLKQKLTEGGVFNSVNPWFEKGHTLDEGLMMVIYTSRLDREAVEIEATRAMHRKISQEAATAPNLQVRKQAERQKEAVEGELKDLNKAAERFLDWELDDLEGNARMYLRGDEVVKVTFTLPNGLYKITVTDSEAGEKTQKLLRINEGEGGFDLTPPIKSGQIFVANENGKNEIISLD